MSLSPRISRLDDQKRKIYELCRGETFKIIDIRNDCATFDVGSAWEHVDSSQRHEFTLELNCLEIVHPIAEDQWKTLSRWFEEDASLEGKVIGGDEKDLKVQLADGILADLPLQYLENQPSSFLQANLGKSIRVRLVMLNCLCHLIRVAPDPR